jgi:hypothetical protein
VLVDQAHELTLHLSDEHHAYDVHRGRSRNPQAALELRLDAELVEHRRDLRAPAVDDDGLEPGEPEEGDVLGEGALEAFVGHGVAAVLHHDDLPVVALEPGQCGGQDGCLGRLDGGTRVDVAHDEYALFSWT